MPEHDIRRSVLTARLRALADWLDANPGIPVSPYTEMTINSFSSMDEAREIRASAPGGWSKANSTTSKWITYKYHPLPGADPDKWQVSYNLNISKEDTCERVQTGVKHIEEHDEPIYEWKCAPEEKPDGI